MSFANAHKYNAQKVTTDGITFDSKAEERRYWQLKKDNNIERVQVHPKFLIFPETRKCVNCGKNFDQKYSKCPICDRKLVVFREISYVADFQVTYKNEKVSVEDVKGVETEAFKLKRKLFEAAYPHLTLSIVRLNGKKTIITTGGA